MFDAKKRADERTIRSRYKDKNFIFKLAKKFKHDNRDVVGEKCVRDDNGNPSYSDDAKKTAWMQHYERLEAAGTCYEGARESDREDDQRHCQNQ